MSDFSARKRKDYFLLIFTLLLVFLAAARTPLDTDLWWHLAAGRETWVSAAPMVVDTFSFTRMGQVWLNHSWLSQVMLFGLYQTGGMLALGAWVAVMATLSLGLTYAQMRGPAIFRAFLIVLACAVAAVVWTARPQMVSLVLFAGLGWILYQYKWRKTDRLWLLPILFLAWTNLHGGWALGFMLIGCLFGGELLNHWLRNPAPEVLDWHSLRRLALWGLACVPVLALHPNGLAILKIPFETVGVQALQQSIQEWASPDFHELYQQPYLWLLLALLATLGLAGRKVDGTDLLTAVCFGALGLIARRNFGPFALAAAPVLSRYLWAVLQSWRQPLPDLAGNWGPGAEIPEVVHRRPRWQKVLNLGLVGLFFAVGLFKLWVVSAPFIVAPAIAANNPLGAVQILQSENRAGRILNEYQWGGYLDWALPGQKNFIDGRTDLFGDEVITEWTGLMQAGAGWQTRLEAWKIDWVLVAPDRPLNRELAQLAGWTSVYSDEVCRLWKRTN